MMLRKQFLLTAVSAFMLCLMLPLVVSGCGSNGPAKEGDKVSVHYTLFLADGTEYETSVGGSPLEFVIGEGQFLAQFEQAVIGLEPGETRKVDIKAADAYGEYDEDLVFSVSRDQLEDGFEPQVGETVYSQDEAGNVWMMVVVAVSEEEITVDANSPLAGEDLTFEIELLKIR
jgi:peptidylprolyl isomerase